MENEEPRDEPKRWDLPTKVSCLVGAGVWWFLSGPPSTGALLAAAFLLAYLCLGFCYLALTLPTVDPEKDKEQLKPGSQPEMVLRRKLFL